MKEVYGDLWEYPADVHVITTNGFIKKNGEAVMGRGCALQAAGKWPELPRILGQCIRNHGNVVTYSTDSPHLVFFPVKDNWWEKAKASLIEQSAKQLVVLTNNLGWQTVVLPRPGCGNGGLSWEEVKPVIEPILDERFHVINYWYEQ